MPTSINLQAQFHYGIVPLIILFFILISPLIIKIKKDSKNRKIKYVDKKTNIVRVEESVKDTYVKRIKKIEKDYDNDEKHSRECFLRLSALIREFVKEYAGIDVTVKTLAEIRGVKIPTLEMLIEEYYGAEFAPDKKGDFISSAEKTIEAIKKWN